VRLTLLNFFSCKLSGLFAAAHIPHYSKQRFSHGFCCHPSFASKIVDCCSILMIHGHEFLLCWQTVLAPWLVIGCAQNVRVQRRQQKQVLIKGPLLLLLPKNQCKWSQGTRSQCISLSSLTLVIKKGRTFVCKGSHAVGMCTLHCKGVFTESDVG